MTRIKYFGFLLLLLTGCALFKRTTKNTDQRLEELQQESISMVNGRRTMLKNGERMSYRIDSAAADYKLFLWPKGVLTLGPAGGFFGEFDSVILIGKTQQLNKLAQRDSTNEHESEEWTQDNHQKNAVKKTANISEKRSVYDAKWLILIVLSLLLVIFWLKKVKKTL